MDSKDSDKKNWKTRFVRWARMYEGPFGSDDDKNGLSWAIINSVFLGVSLGVGAGVLFVAYRYRFLFGDSHIVKLAIFVAVWISFLTVSQVMTNQRFNHSRRQQNWLISVMKGNFERLEAVEHSILPQGTAPTDANMDASRWPWGRHHTEALGHLEAAACRFWKLYDPVDPSTAPTNNMVSDWLHEERRVSKDKAKAIASILRADGLATGPR